MAPDSRNIGLCCMLQWLLLRPRPVSDPLSLDTYGPKRCFFLESVPLEVREMILRYCLPWAIPYRGGTAWYKGSMSILRANKQLYEEGTKVLYHYNTFSLDVIYDCSYFAMTWLTPTKDPARVLHVRRQRAFPECFSKRNIPMMRKFEITVRHVDSYTGMIKYGYGGGGLTEGLKTQVAFLCQVLRRLSTIDVLEISYQCQEVRHKAETQNVLDPFYSLENVREVRTSGHVMDATAEELKTRLPAARQRHLERPNGPKENEEDECGALQSREELFSGEEVLSEFSRKGLASYRGYDKRDI